MQGNVKVYQSVLKQQTHKQQKKWKDFTETIASGKLGARVILNNLHYKE